MSTTEGICTIRLDGAVEHPVVFGRRDLAQLSGQVADVSSLVAGRSGAAVRLASVLAAAGVHAEATHLTVEADDGEFSASVPLPAVAEAVLVHSCDGSSLPREKGGPFRLLIPDAARCGGAEVDKCANVKGVAVLRLDVGRGRDTRPSTKAEHVAMHRKPGHARAETPR